MNIPNPYIIKKNITITPCNNNTDDDSVILQIQGLLMMTSGLIMVVSDDAMFNGFWITICLDEKGKTNNNNNELKTNVIMTL